jgi:hypothetical protein
MRVARNSGLMLKLDLTDILDHDLDDHTLIELADTRGSCRYRNQEQVQRTLILDGIPRSPAALYRVRIAPLRYRPRQFFVPLKEGEIASRRIAFPVEPNKVAGIQAPPHSRLAPALQRLLPETTYASLAPLPKACLLNVAAKAAATILGGGAACLDHWVRILSVQQDRLLIRTSTALEEAAALSPLFENADALLHTAPAGYRRTRSFKTKDAHGSLQLTFFQSREAGEDYLVDADIDEAQGLEHLFEVMRNAVTGPTNPYNVREILIAAQGIDPGYRFRFT